MWTGIQQFTTSNNMYAQADRDSGDGVSAVDEIVENI
jgi:hypothetical protein